MTATLTRATLDDVKAEKARPPAAPLHHHGHRTGRLRGSMRVVPSSSRLVPGTVPSSSPGSPYRGPGTTRRTE